MGRLHWLQCGAEIAVPMSLAAVTLSGGSKQGILDKQMQEQAKKNSCLTLQGGLSEVSCEAG